GRRRPPGQPGPARRRPGPPAREAAVGLVLARRLGLDARAVPERGLGARVDDAGVLGPAVARAGHEDRARPVAGADEDVLGLGRAVHEVPRAQRALVALDDEQAFAREDEEVLLVALAVVDPARLPRLQDRQRHADVGKRDLVALEDAGGAEGLVRPPG